MKKSFLDEVWAVHSAKHSPTPGPVMNEESFTKAVFEILVEVQREADAEKEKPLIAQLDEWVSNNINVATEHRDKPGFLCASRLVAMQVLSKGFFLPGIADELFALGWAAGLRGQYWMLYVKDSEGSAYTQAQVGYWNARRDLEKGSALSREEILDIARKAGFDFQNKAHTQFTRPFEYSEEFFYRFAEGLQKARGDSC